MCLLESFCCCISLTVGMHLICLSYVGLFSFLALFKSQQDWQNVNVLEWWVYGGLCASICGWIGLRWEKKFFVSILFVYDVCVATARAGLLYMFRYYPHNMNIIENEEQAKANTFFLIWNLYVLWIEISYLLRDETPPNVFHAVPQNVIITEVRRETYEPAAVANEYQRQLPYVVQPALVPVPVNVNIPPASYAPQYPAYPSNYPHSYPTTTNSSMVNANAPIQPFPYDAPPPYSEIKQSCPSAPSA